MTAPRTAEQCIDLAVKAILRGDYAERDRLCDRARALMKAEGEAAALVGGGGLVGDRGQALGHHDVEAHEALHDAVVQHTAIAREI